MLVADHSTDVIHRIGPGGDREEFATGLHTPTGITLDDSGQLLVANRASGEIVRVSGSGDVSLVADGLATPVGVARAAGAEISVSNYAGGVSRVTPDGAVRDHADVSGPGAGHRG